MRSSSLETPPLSNREEFIGMYDEDDEAEGENEDLGEMYDDGAVLVLRGVKWISPVPVVDFEVTVNVTRLSKDQQ